MKRLSLAIITLVIILPLASTQAKESQEPRKQRQEAQKERQVRKNERNKTNNEATRTFREYIQDLKREYQELVADLDTEFKLAKVDLQGAKQAKVSAAEAEFQKKWSALFFRPEGDTTRKTFEELEKEAKVHADKLFKIQRESAEIFHKAEMANLQKKHDLLSERDKKAMEKAASLGLTNEYPPILATAIGGTLTKQEERWNEREKKEVLRLKKQNDFTVTEFRNGSKLREWERNNQEEDFKLKWEEKEELHTIQTQQTYFNRLIMQGGQDLKAHIKEYNTRLAELGKQRQLAQIKYNKIRQKNNITRREERKKILGP